MYDWWLRRWLSESRSRPLPVVPIRGAEWPLQAEAAVFARRLREPPQVRITAHTVAAHVQPQSIPAGNAIKSSREERPKLFVDLRIILFGHHAHPGL